MSISTIPEEIAERIIASCVASTKHITSSSNTPTATALETRSRVAPLLVNHTWQRIATPLFYHTVHLSSPAQTSRLCATFAAQPELATHVRSVIVSGIWPELATLFRQCPTIHTLEVTMDGLNLQANSSPAQVAVAEKTVESVADALSSLDVHHLIVRKPMSSPKTCKVVYAGLAKVVEAWPSLNNAEIAFRLSDDSLTAPLINALSSAPSLTAIHSQVPSTWNTALLKISANPSLQHITLHSNFASDAPMPISATGLFLNESKKWEHLSDLIHAGTQFIRKAQGPAEEHRTVTPALSRQVSKEDVTFARVIPPQPTLPQPERV